MGVSPDSRGHRMWPSHSRALLVVGSVLKAPPSSMGFRLERHSLRSKLYFLKESPDVLRPSRCRLEDSSGSSGGLLCPVCFSQPGNKERWWTQRSQAALLGLVKNNQYSGELVYLILSR